MAKRKSKHIKRTAKVGVLSDEKSIDNADDKNITAETDVEQISEEVHSLLNKFYYPHPGYEVEKPIRQNKTWRRMYFALPFANVIGSISLALSGLVFANPKYTHLVSVKPVLLVLFLIIVKNIAPRQIKAELIRIYTNKELISRKLNFLIPINFVVGILLMSICIYPLIYASGFPSFADKILTMVIPTLSVAARNFITFVSTNAVSIITGIISNYLFEWSKLLFKKKEITDKK